MSQNLIVQLRLYSGLVLFAYVVGHLINHAFGLISLAAMDAGLAYSIGPWRTLPGTVLLAGATVVHVLAALWVLYQRRNLRMARWQWGQTLLGLAIPFLLISHVLGTRFLADLWGAEVNYTLLMTYLWVIEPVDGVLNALALIVVWLHACIGIHYWLRLKPWYANAQAVAYALALLIPALALAGYVSAGNRVLEIVSTDPEWVPTVVTNARLTPEMADWVVRGANIGSIGILVVLIALFGARAARLYVRRLARRPRLTYSDGRVLEIEPGMTMLEAIRAARIPHPSVCGGRGRCSTCRVHVGVGADTLPPPSPDEQKLLDRISAGHNVRLACQTRPNQDVSVTPLLPSAATAADGHQRAAYRRSEERSVAILFADMRGFTNFTEARLPYDVVFVLNRYRTAMAEAIEAAGGVVNEFVGDGIMALFGLETDADDGCRRALAAAAQMREKLRTLNDSLASDLPEPLRIGIGIHAGPVIVGEMGYDNLKGITVVGDAVNTASRLEQMTKQFEAGLVVSDEAARRGGLPETDTAIHEVDIRGRAQRLTVHVVA